MSDAISGTAYGSSPTAYGSTGGSPGPNTSFGPLGPDAPAGDGSAAGSGGPAPSPALAPLPPPPVSVSDSALAALFQADLGRAPTASEVAALQAMLAQGQSLDQVRQSLAASPPAAPRRGREREKARRIRQQD